MVRVEVYPRVWFFNHLTYIDTLPYSSSLSGYCHCDDIRIDVLLLYGQGISGLLTLSTHLCTWDVVPAYN